ncbi:MAG: TerC family protein [Burkholderiaceae bacterium]|nr:TerC family protein [Burkholderiaceae bacterium]
MEWLFDPAIWAGLLTLVVLEIVLGIDNLIFIAILADKLPPHQRDRARMIGLSLALIMRLGLLTVVSWLVTLTAPLFSIGSFSFSGRDLILLIGGLFLLFKATSELHERLEGTTHQVTQSKVYASFSVVVVQIVVLDAVFSLDAVITAIGMVDELPVMMTAVLISMGMMMWASKPLTRFVNAHPTVVVLCLSFLLMIGLMLTAEGLGFKIPKAYLYAAIGFSILIEFFNQLARRSSQRNAARGPIRDRTAQAVLRMLGGRSRDDADAPDHTPADTDEAPAFGADERSMVSGVLTLGERSIRSIMTPRTDISWINTEDDIETIRSELRSTPHSFFPICSGELDNVVGVARSKDLLANITDSGGLGDLSDLRQPVIVHESAKVLRIIDTLRQSAGQLILVTDEYGAIQGLVTPIDILEAIAGEFPDEDEQPAIQTTGPDSWRVDGATDLHYLAQTIETSLWAEGEDPYASFAAFLLARFGALPEVGDSIELEGFRFVIVEISHRRIASVDVTRLGKADPETTDSTQ